VTGVVRVRRSGGLAGRVSSGEIDPDTDERGDEVRALEVTVHEQQEAPRSWASWLADQ